MKIALLGDGRMGAAVAAEAMAAGHTVTARLGRVALQEEPGVVAARLGAAEVAVDFSVGEQVARSVEVAAAAGVDLVIGTTGWDAEHVDLHAVTRVGRGVVHGSNFSLGVHLFLHLVRQAVLLVDGVDGYDMHVVETHHRHKRDRPSGTAVLLAEEILDASVTKTQWMPGPPRGAAEADTLYVTSIRTGEVPGTHVVGVEGPHDRMEIRHDAHGRTGFARGAVRAAEWIQGKTGVFPFQEVVADLLDRRQAVEQEEER